MQPRKRQVTDTLSAIDAAVEDRCSHCGDPLPPNSASAWWCDPDCQRAWSEQHADNPDEVKYRPDAANYPWSDDAVVELNEPPDSTPASVEELRWLNDTAATISRVIAAFERTVIRCEHSSLTCARPDGGLQCETCGAGHEQIVTDLTQERS